MTTAPRPTYSCFTGHRLIKTAPLPTIALTLKTQREADPSQPLQVFDNTTGRTIDIDTRGTDKEVLERLALAYPEAAVGSVEEENTPTEPGPRGRGRGRPKLGVVAREITLLPRHWEWLAEQPGGASVALRKLVEEARRATADRDERRKATDRAYHFMQTIAGDLPGFEEASRALFAHDAEQFRQQIANWPADVRDHAVLLAFDVVPSTSTTQAKP